MDGPTQNRLRRIEDELRKQSLTDHDLLIGLSARFEIFQEVMERLPCKSDDPKINHTLRLAAIESELGAIRRNAQRIAAVAGSILAALVTLIVNFGKRLLGGE